jgi:hypothetical protein
MSNLPDLPHSSGGLEPTPMQVARAAREARKAELEVFRHSVSAWVSREKDLIDTDVLEDVIGEATDAELRFLEEYRQKAGDSEAGQQIVASKLVLLDSLTNRRISRRFRNQ